MTFVNIPFAAFLVLLSTGAAFAQSSPAVAALIDQSIANAEQNAKAALSYTFHENYVGSTTTAMLQAQGTGARGTAFSRQAMVDPSAMGTGRSSESSTQYDVLFIKGIPYRRVIGVNHKPLSAESSAAESRRYDAAVAAFYAMSDEQRLRMAEGGNSLVVDPKQLTSRYDCKITGHAKIQKRPATVVRCKLRADLSESNGSTANPVSTGIKLWIDDQEPFFVRTRAMLSRAIDEGRKLTMVTVQWRRIDGVWHQTSIEVDWVGPEGSGTKGKVVDTFSDFKRFRSEMKILPGHASDVSLPSQP